MSDELRRQLSQAKAERRRARTERGKSAEKQTERHLREQIREVEAETRRIEQWRSP